MYRARHVPADGPGLLIDPRLEDLQTLFFLFRRYVVRVARRRRAGPLAVDETERLVEADFRNKIQRGLEIGIGLAGKADDEIGGYAYIRPDFPQLPYFRLVFEHRVPALHAGKYAVRPALHGQVQVIDQFGHPAVNVNQALGEFDRVGSRVTYPADTADRGDVLDQVRQFGAAAFKRGAAVGIDVLAQQRDLFYALSGKVGRFADDVIQGPGDFLTAGVRHHTESAVFAAPFHDGDEGNGAVRPGFGQPVELFDFGKGDIRGRFAGALRLVVEAGQPVQGLGAEYHVHEGRAAVNRRTFLTGHATPDADHETGLLSFPVAPAAEFREQFFLGFFPDGTGIENDEIGLIRLPGFLHSVGDAQHVPHLCGIVFVHLAAECLDKEFFSHFQSGLQGPVKLHLRGDLVAMGGLEPPTSAL